MSERYDVTRPRHVSDFVIESQYFRNLLASETTEYLT